MKCPSCNDRLKSKYKGDAIYWYCVSNDGYLMGYHLLKQLTVPEIEKVLWDDFKAAQKGARPCPECEGPMAVVSVDSPIEVQIDACPICYLIWFDRNELEAFRIKEGIVKTKVNYESYRSIWAQEVPWQIRCMLFFNSL